MKYDKDTMNSLQEAYASVNEVKYYSGKDRNKKTGTPKKLQNQTSKTSNKKLKSSIPTGGDGTAYMGEEQDLTGITLKQKKELERQEQLKKASKKAPTAQASDASEPSSETNSGSGSSAPASSSPSSSAPWDPTSNLAGRHPTRLCLKRLNLDLKGLYFVLLLP